MLALTSQYKVTLTEYYTDKGDLTTATLADMGGTSTGKQVSSIALANQAGGTVSVVATFGTSGVAAGIQNSTFTIATQDGGRNWDCGSRVDPALLAANPVPDKLVPGACK